MFICITGTSLYLAFHVHVLLMFCYMENLNLKTDYDISIKFLWRLFWLFKTLGTLISFALSCSASCSLSVLVQSPNILATFLRSCYYCWRRAARGLPPRGERGAGTRIPARRAGWFSTMCWQPCSNKFTALPDTGWLLFAGSSAVKP